jgi:hypothetical protein
MGRATLARHTLCKVSCSVSQQQRFSLTVVKCRAACYLHRTCFVLDTAYAHEHSNTACSVDSTGTVVAAVALQVAVYQAFDADCVHTLTVSAHAVYAYAN